MAVSVANVLDVPYRIVGNQKETVYDVTCDNKYVTLGEPLTFANLGLNYVERAICNIQKVGGSVNVTEAAYDKTNQKILLYDETPAEVASEADVSNIVVRVVSKGF